MRVEERLDIEMMGSRILVEPDALPEELGGIAVPETARQDHESGVVRAVGPYAGGWVKLGSRVIFPAYGGYKIRFADEVFRIMTQDEILATVPEEEV